MTSSFNIFVKAGDGKQDGRFIKKLEWVSPNGELPGTYEKYLSMHPIKPAFFSETINYYVSQQSNDNLISILVDADLYLLIKTSLNQYIEDLNGQGYSVFYKYCFSWLTRGDKSMGC
jgi:hypothetical protein